MNTPNVTLYLGGTRSGKSARAEARVCALAEGPVLYVATAEAGDAAMSERIRRHRERRPHTWQTVERPLRLAEGIAGALEALPEKAGTPTVMIDCVTLWVSNILFALPDPDDLAALEHAVEQEVEALLELMRAARCRWVLVSGETGLGGIAPTRIGRHYCDGLGLANQRLAANARDVYLVVAGRQLRLED